MMHFRGEGEGGLQDFHPGVYVAKQNLAVAAPQLPTLISNPDEPTRYPTQLWCFPKGSKFHSGKIARGIKKYDHCKLSVVRCAL